MSVISPAALARLELSTDHYHDQNQQQAVQDKSPQDSKLPPSDKLARLHLQKTSKACNLHAKNMPACIHACIIFANMPV